MKYLYKQSSSFDNLETPENLSVEVFTPTIRGG